MTTNKEFSEALGDISCILKSSRKMSQRNRLRRPRQDPRIATSAKAIFLYCFTSAFTAPWNSEALRVYVLETLRFPPSAAPCIRKSKFDSALNEWHHGQAIKKGDTVILDSAAAGCNGQRFPHPDSLLLTRPLKVYQHMPFIEGLHDPLARDITVVGLAEQLPVFRKTEGLRRAPGASGTLRKVRENG